MVLQYAQVGHGLGEFSWTVPVPKRILTSVQEERNDDDEVK
jgi:hypothetical protein